MACYIIKIVRISLHQRQPLVKTFSIFANQKVAKCFFFIRIKELDNVVSFFLSICCLFCRSPVSWVHNAIKIILLSRGLWYSTWDQSDQKYPTVCTFLNCQLKSFLKLTRYLFNLIGLYKFYFCSPWWFTKWELFSGFNCSLKYGFLFFFISGTQHRVILQHFG